MNTPIRRLRRRSTTTRNNKFGNTKLQPRRSLFMRLDCINVVSPSPKAPRNAGRFARYDPCRTLNHLLIEITREIIDGTLAIERPPNFRITKIAGENSRARFRCAPCSFFFSHFPLVIPQVALKSRRDVTRVIVYRFDRIYSVHESIFRRNSHFRKSRMHSEIIFIIVVSFCELPFYINFSASRQLKPTGFYAIDCREREREYARYHVSRVENL